MTLPFLDANILHNGINDEVPVPPPLPELTPAFVSEMTFNSTSKILKDFRSYPSTSYLGCNSLILGLQPLLNMNHACDYALLANHVLSSTITYYYTIPLIFCDEPKHDTNSMHPLSYRQSLFLETLQGLSTVNAINVINNNSVTKNYRAKMTSCFYETVS